MKELKGVVEGVNKLLEMYNISNVPKWEYKKKTSEMLTDEIEIEGKIYPIYTWRNDPQIQAIARNAQKNIGGSCSAKASGMVSKDYGLEAFLYKELDTAEWVLDSRVEKMTSYYNKNAVNVIMKMENKKIAVLELGAVLPEGAEEQTRHTAWGKEGMESTRIVSTKIRPQAIYMYKDSVEPQTYNDTALDLYGLNREEVIIAVSIYKMLTHRNELEYYLRRDKEIKGYIKQVIETSN